MAVQSAFDKAPARAGTVLVAAGERVDSVRLLEHGRVALGIPAPADMDPALAGVQAGHLCAVSLRGEALLGGLAWLDGAPSPYTVVARGACRLSRHREPLAADEALPRSPRLGILAARTLFAENGELARLFPRRLELLRRLERLSAALPGMAAAFAASGAADKARLDTLLKCAPLADPLDEVAAALAPFGAPQPVDGASAFATPRLDVYEAWMHLPEDEWRSQAERNPALLTSVCRDLAAEEARAITALQALWKRSVLAARGIGVHLARVAAGLRPGRGTRARALWLAELGYELRREMKSAWNTALPEETAPETGPRSVRGELAAAGVAGTRYAVIGVLTMLCFASGFSSLLYETLWLKKFATLLGNTTYTTSAIIASFLTGLALGAWFFGKLLRKSRHGILWYGVFEGLVALAAVGLTWLLSSGAIPFERIGVLSADDTGHVLARFGLGFGLVLVPTFFMGGTLPALSRHFEFNRVSPGLAAGILYGVNTLGACLGTFVAGFFFIRELGLAATQDIALRVNLLVAGGAILLAPLGYLVRARDRALENAARGPAPARLPEPLPAALPSGPAAGAPTLPTLAVLAAIAGFLALTYEVILFRILGYVLGNRTFAVSTLLAVYLLGIGAGSLLVARLLDALRLSLRAFSALYLVAGAWIVFSIVFFPDFLAAAQDLEGKLGMKETWHYITVRCIEAAVIVLPPTLLFGAAFPLLVRAWRERQGTLAEGVGGVYFFNTVGSVLGTFVAGLFLVPLVGTYESAVFCGVGCVLLGHRLFFAGNSRLRWATRLVSVAVAVAAGIMFWNFAAARKVFPWIPKGETLVEAREDAMGALTVTRGIGGLTIWADGTKIGYPVGGNSLVEYVQRAQGHIPALLHPHPTNAIVIGLGGGITPGALALHPGMRMVEAIEIYPAVPALIRHFAQWNEDVLKKTNVRIIAADGRFWLAASRRRYDLISVNITNPYLPGCAALYTVEFYEQARAKLARGGLFLTHLYGQDWRYLLKTLAHVFPHVRLYTGYPYTLFAVASLAEFRNPTAQEFAARLGGPALANSVARAGFPHVWAFWGREAYGPAFIDTVRRDAGIPLHRDDLPYIEYRWFGDVNSNFFSQ